MTPRRGVLSSVSRGPIDRAGLGMVAVVVATVVGLGFPAVSSAARVLVLQPDGRAIVDTDPFLASVTPTPRPPAAGPAQAAAPSARAANRTIRRDLARLVAQRAISAADYASYVASFGAAIGAVKRLSGVRASELQAVITNLGSLAVRRLLTPSRLSVLFLTLDRNVQWWATGPLLSTYQRVEFAGSRLVWEYYPGQGIELQELGSFSTAAALCNAGPSQYPACTGLLSELIPLAASRNGRLAWEYYFNFDGGVPPWTSAMSQGTALEALARAYKATKNSAYLALGDRALALFTAAPPAGVAVKTALGARYVQYTFAPSRGDEIINAFLQSLIGLDEFAQASGNPLAAGLFAGGNAEAQAELPGFDTGAWSLYQPRVEDDLSYHELVTGFLQRLCALTQASVYCTTGNNFTRYLKTPPSLELLTTRVKARSPTTVYFQLSKISRVGITILRGPKTLFLTSAPFSYGRHSFQIPALPTARAYMVRLSATDLAGNFTRIVGTVRASAQGARGRSR